MHGEIKGGGCWLSFGSKPDVLPSCPECMKTYKIYFFRLYMGVTLVSHVDRRTLTEGTRKQGAEENISICEGGINRPSQKTT
jgi:hypothetical protein